MAEQVIDQEPKFPEAVGKLYELKGYKPGIITFPKGIGEVDLTTVSLETAAKVNAIRPDILVKIEAKKPEVSKP